ncbi:hypothetical protein [Nocardia sp. XZ_19_385]|uniref:hypothetical protein n=1 Tax=Nocardia sp. XZ_19_385 TaxID=2769488 RepID=UPI0018904DE2|nr:hypothetical protein [Nocardia sp. XZ_19_385]
MEIDISCPNCGRSDWVQSVPAVRASGVQTVTGVDYFTGVGVAPSGLVPAFGTATVERTTVSNLARSLPLTPYVPSSGKLIALGTVLAIPGLMVIVTFTAMLVNPEPGRTAVTTFLAGVLAFALFSWPAALAFTVVVNRVRRKRRVARGRNTASAVWRAGQYCHGCGLCFWPYSPAPHIPARQSIPPRQFTWLVWSVGGYANLMTW